MLFTDDACLLLFGALGRIAGLHVRVQSNLFLHCAHTSVQSLFVARLSFLSGSTSLFAQEHLFVCASGV